MVYAAVCCGALIASALTFVSGFGLGTLLLPVFAFFVPVELAVAATACVHLANNVFKFVLVGSRADRGVLLRFGVVAAACAVGGALAKHALEGFAPLAVWNLSGREHAVTGIKVAVGGVIVGFAALELNPRFERMSFDRRWLALGGALSGFFGGLSGHQGALRSAFLVRAGLTKEALVATGVVSAVMVDVSRLAVYWKDTSEQLSASRGLMGPVIAGSVAAFAGSMIGARVMKKITMGAVRAVIGVGLLLFGVAMIAGLV